ncbi:C2 domain-containing protein 3-like [Mercenaria mercenaria]|uniref:C2 domain-containing protein 3-like n=1 Tax=Mercenaria mercenaria TaxID=6596 RepID=UPI00234F33B5|nr:C2 domain-containing protein 3-like [Mercenaria mercenaria]
MREKDEIKANIIEMVKKKVKASQKLKIRENSWHQEDVQVNTGLPPQVEGQLRCFCRVSVTQITWEVPNTPDVTYVSLKWWGEPGNGIVFRPVDLKCGRSGQAKTTARFPVRSGPKQFTAYLADMSSLVLEVLSGPMQVPIGTVDVPNIGLLAPNRPVNGLYPIISPTEEKIGELHVSLVLESLMASYDSMGSIPTTDVSMETYTSHVTQESTYPKQSRPTPHTDQPQKPMEDPFISPASHQNVETRLQNGYTEDLRQHLRYESDPAEQRFKQMENGSAVAITTNGDVIKTSSGEAIQNRQNVRAEGASQGPADDDLLSVLLDRGNKLREQMIISSLESKSKAGNHEVTEPAILQSISGLPDKKEVDMSLRSTDGSFLHEILKAEKLYGGGEDVDLEEAAVDLVFGDQLTDDIRLFGRGSPNQSMSDDDIISDQEDPVHSESILNELFYKNPMSEEELSGDDRKRRMPTKHLDEEANMRPPSRSSSVSSLNLAFPPEPAPKKTSKSKTPPRTPKRKSRVKLRRKGSKKRKSSRSRSRASASEGSDSEALSTVSTPRSESSRVSFDMVPSDIDEPPEKEVARHKKVHKVDGLSVERLTLLGRVHVARVTIDQLMLKVYDLDTSSSKPKPKTKYGIRPPKASPKAKKSCTYFIEYQFPVVATSRDKYSPNAMATEVMRVVSRNVKNGVVTFNHRSVFPVMFDGTAVEKWWKSALIFKLYSRTAGQKVPSLIGSCGIPLKSILKSESLYIGKDLEVRQSDKTGNTSLNGSKLGPDGILGALKIIVELASDSKEFPTQLARTKLAEITGKAKIVPIAQTPPLPSQPPPLVQSLQQAPKPPVPPAVQQKVSEPERGFPRGREGRSRSRSPAHKMPASSEPPQLDGLSAPLPVSVQHYQGDQVVLNYPSIQQQQGEVMTLHALLMVPDGRGITTQGIPSLMAAKRHPVFQQPSALTAPGVRARDMCVRNTYLVCKMFWCDEAVHSAVCWGTSEPQFKFQQVAPVLMSQSLLERLKNNFMIVEVWDKKTSADNDKLVGIVKLSLHQFYMSFRDKRIASALLKSQYPVIAVENSLPVVDVFSGSQFGQLNVLLAMGSAEQVAHLVKMKTDGMSAVSAPERPHHYLERQDLLHQGDTVPAQIGTESVVEHVFEIVIEGVRGLSLFENMIWGEADCFVQYSFPAQQQSNPPGAPVIRHAVPTMKAFRTATTLCIADPTFHDVTRHRILLPQGTPVQRELLTACANAGSGSGGLPFELWCRYYHPNVRDQCIAKANLPLAKLCAMITMQKRGEPSVQTFSFPLTHVQSDLQSEEHKSKAVDAGLMDVTVHYKNQVMQSETGAAAANKNLGGAQVCISVGVIRACGLKASAESVAYLDQGMQYPAEVGVNSYVRVKLTFLGAEGERITRTVARSFSPEFSHFMDFPCPLLWTEPNSDALCLAEILETAEASFEVWHQVPGMTSDLDRQLSALTADGVSGRQIVEKTSDVLLGSTTLPLVNLLSQRTGINGWYAVNIPVSAWNQDQQESQEPAGEGSRSGQSGGLPRVGGGLELSIKFAHHEDRERVIHAARGVGWSPVNLDIEQDDWESEDEDSNRYHHINITIDHVNFPVQNALIAGQNTLDKTAKCYVRYKFYDKAAVMTKFSPVTVNSSGYIVSQPRNRHDLQLPDSSMFRWYLREERLEVQVWVTFGSHRDDLQRPKHRDKLIGSAYISMETLSDPRRKQHRVSGMFPLFKPGTCNLGGGYIRAHITAKPQFGRNDQSERQEGLITLDGEEIDADYDPDDSFHQIISHKPGQKSPKKSSSPIKEVTMAVESSESGETTDTFSVMIQVERALHLPLMHDKQKNTDYMPNTYVSYPTGESTIPSYSMVFHNSDNPVWDHEHETKLNIEMLHQENKHLVFKVWHKPDGAPKSPDKLTDRVLGFVSVDLTPLANGLQQISGWYNIMDFNGQVKGQIKINVIPQESVISGETGTTNHVADAFSHPTSASFLSLPPWGTQGQTTSAPGPFSLPSYDLPHFQNHYDQVKQHHEMLQQQLQEHIQQFLRQQEECQGSRPEPVSELSDVTKVTQGLTDVISSVPDPSLYQRETSVYQREPSIHWRPTMPELRQEDSSSRSYLFSNLRKQMQDLDDITSNLRAKLTCKPSGAEPARADMNRLPDFDIPVTSQYPLTSTQSSFTLSNFPRSQNETPRDELAYTGSHGAESSRTVADSGAFSAEQSADKYEDSAPTSQRSCSDRLDTLRSGVTPRDFLDSGINHTNNNSNMEDPEQNVWLTMSPRESEEKKDEYSESGGFSFRHSPRDAVRTPRDARNSAKELEQLLNSHIADTSNGNGEAKTTAEEKVSKSDQKQMSIIQEYSENDKSDSEDEEGENKYYHRYRDLLDKEDDVNDEDEEEEEEEEEEEGEIVVPRRINDVSGKFSPTGEIIMLSDDITRSVPYDFTARQSHEQNSEHSENSSKKTANSIKSGNSEKSDNSPRETDDILQDIESDNEIEPRDRDPAEMMSQHPVIFDEKDSWLSDSDKEPEQEDVVIGYQYLQNQGHLMKHKPQRQDSDTGYSSRDNVSESYLTPSAGGTNSETDISRLHEHEHWDHRDSDDHVFSERPKNRLLANVELESTGGSFGLKYDLGHSRISSAGSRQTHKSSEPSVSESFDEKEEQDYIRRELTPIESGRESQPVSARTAELEEFFNDEISQKRPPIGRPRTDSESSYNSERSDTINRVNTDRTYNNYTDHEHHNMENNDDNFEHRDLTPRHRKQEPVPNFFMPVQHLEESMRTLQVVTNKVDSAKESEKVAVASEMVSKLTTKDKFAQLNTKSRLPTAEETKRIAKIFSSKFS